MIRIAIVEDEPESREQLIRYLRRYEDENDVKFQVTEYKDGLDILDEYGGQFDLILLDIRMKFVDGMETARKIREKDRNVIIVFITNMAQYAIQGYDVEARGFILKPVRYSAFSQQILYTLLLASAIAAGIVCAMTIGHIVRRLARACAQKTGRC